MKHLILSVILSLLFATAAYAENDDVLKLYEANADGQIIVEDEDTEYILHEVEEAQVFGVQAAAPMTLSENHYSAGFFDNPTAGYTVTDVYGNKTDQIDKSLYWNSLSIESIVNAGAPININFDRQIEINEVYLNWMMYGQIHFFLNDVKVHEIKDMILYFKFENPLEFNKIVFYSPSGTARFGDFEIFENVKIDYVAASNFVANTRITDATISFKNPDSFYFKYNDIYVDDVLVEGQTTDEAIELTDLETEKSYTVTIRSYYSDGKYIDLNKVITTKRDTTPPAAVTNLTAVQVADSIELTYDLPTDDDFSHVRLTRNGIKIADNITDTKYVDDDIKEDATYMYRVFAYDKMGNVSNAESVTIKTTSKEVSNLKATVKYDSVKLNWQNPKNENFEDVTIYRKEKGIVAAMARTFSFDATAGYTQLFRTNGTMFEDLTVASDTTYTYLLTSTIADEVTDGVTIDVKTPKVYVSGGAVEETADDYIINWTSPTVGKLMVKVGGVQYAIVNAVDKQITIPKAQMIYNKLGNPDVLLIPVDDAGNPIGDGVKPGAGDFGDISLSDAGLDATTIMLATMGLIALIAFILLLAFAFKVSPKIIDLIFSSFK